LKSIVSRKYFWIILLTGQLAVVGIYLLVFTLGGLSVKNALIDAILLSFFAGLGIVVAANNLNYYRPSNFNYSFLLIWCLALSAFSVFVSRLIFLSGFTIVPKYLEFVNNSFFLRLLLTYIIMVLQIAIVLIWYIFQDFQENAKRNTETETLNKEAELYKLRQQLQPHFLFNSLNSINALIGFKPSEARNMIQQLSDYLRFTIKKEDSQLVNFEDEIQYLSLYLNIEKVRFGHRLTTQIDIDDEVMQLKIPALLLQPLLENAIKYGLYDTLDPICINIKAKKIENSLEIEVRNPFDGQSSQLPEGTGYGLKATKRRLELLFSRFDLLETQKIDNEFIATLKIPQKP
jgi:two-component system, LytTR family, sensor kinase